MKNTILLFGLFAFNCVRVFSQCSVHVVAEGSTTFCTGDSVTLKAVANDTINNGVDSLDQSQLIYNAGMSARTITGYGQWQSFTAGKTGTFSRLDVGFFNLISGVCYLTIWSGTGTTGALLDSEVVNVNVPYNTNLIVSFQVNAPVIAGHVYTFQLRPGPGIPDPYGVQVENPGTYAGGEMYLVNTGNVSYPTGFDMIFQTYVSAGGRAGNSSLSYDWSNGATDSAIVVKTGGNYSVIISDTNGCSARSDTVPVKILPVPVVSVQPNTSIICSTDSIQLCADTGYSYYWNTGQTTACIYAAQGGNYYVTATDTNHCTAESNHASIQVYPIPSVSITVAGDTFQAFNAHGCQWFLNDSLINGATNSIYVASQTGSYTVQITDSNGCKATSNAMYYTSSGLENITASKVGVYPNPSANSSFLLSVSPDLIGGRFYLYNTEERLIVTDEIRNSDSPVKCQSPAGVYILHVYSSRQHFTTKVILL